MGFVIKTVGFLGGVVLGLLFLRYNFQLTQLFGHNEYAERFIGTGGTYTMWKGLGILLIIAAIWWAAR